jgi:hypothetical protein
VTRTPGTQFRNPPGASQSRVFRDQRFADRGRSKHQVQPRRNRPRRSPRPLDSRYRDRQRCRRRPPPADPRGDGGMLSRPARAAENCPMDRFLSLPPRRTGYRRLFSTRLRMQLQPRTAEANRPLLLDLRPTSRSGDGYARAGPPSSGIGHKDPTTVKPATGILFSRRASSPSCVTKTSAADASRACHSRV